MRYPFGKYDQAFVPEFNAGAMENPGLVTFRDEYIFRSAVTDAERELRARSIAHEMAHMWFGDLVTMRWWDDLWLNESFAEYMGYRVTAEATRFTDAWTDLRGRAQGLGLRAPTSARRPTRSRRPTWPTPRWRCSTSTASRTPRAPRCCVSWSRWLGDEAFLAGLRDHFASARVRQRHAGRPARPRCREASGRDLAGWAERVAAPRRRSTRCAPR